MIRRVIADEMPFVSHSEDKIGVRSHNMLKYEKSAFGFVLFHRIKYLCDIAVLITRVKGQIYDLVVLRGVFVDIISAVFAYE